MTEKGLRTKKGEVEVDVSIAAARQRYSRRLTSRPGLDLSYIFDSVTGSLAHLDVQGADGKTTAENWADGMRTSMGIALNKFPHMFFL